ncbi:hypothetical protein JOC86_002616 [Bacillus pakistanensis]|uniref:Uncharacterized protein n=1 Tax=Rossellomorea pakistanensis TaxID=992288 RepID=A0ABS2NE23_9BACI|nr:hypothetical protein [Bacillus pakistanensis]
MKIFSALYELVMVVDELFQMHSFSRLNSRYGLLFLGVLNDEASLGDVGAISVVMLLTFEFGRVYPFFFIIYPAPI